MDKPSFQEIPWGSAPPRCTGGLIYFARHPVTRKLHPLAPSKRWTVLLDGEDVTWRTRAADAATGEVVLLVVDEEKAKRGGSRLKPWKIDRERGCVVTEERQGRVEIRYAWPADAHDL